VHGTTVEKELFHDLETHEIIKYFTLKEAQKVINIILFYVQHCLGRFINFYLKTIINN